MAKGNIFDSIKKPKKKVATKKAAKKDNILDKIQEDRNASLKQAKAEQEKVKVVKMPDLDGGEPEHFSTVTATKMKISKARFAKPVLIDSRQQTNASADNRGGQGSAYCDMVFDGSLLHIKSRKTDRVVIVPIGNVTELHPYSK